MQDHDVSLQKLLSDRSSVTRSFTRIKEPYFVQYGKHMSFDQFVVCYLRVAGQFHLAVTRPRYYSVAASLPLTP